MPNEEPTKQDGRTQRAIVIELLDEPRLWMRADLKVKLHDIDPQTVDEELTALVIEGVAVYDGVKVQASRCARHLDALGMVGV
jgi:hypothetical protein